MPRSTRQPMSKSPDAPDPTWLPECTQRRAHTAEAGAPVRCAEYNEAVKEALEDFLATNAITARQMTPEYARRFLEGVLKSHDPRIRDFNVKVMEQRLKYLSRGGQDVDDYDD